ncbi:MAG: xanthine dehydrogenase YagR molybdenum-binding subunit [Gaiellales bacterium]|nr:xanthine dehydrogenase YagR molybdenum-binding subunit [Gaiellales bacterium]
MSTVSHPALGTDLDRIESREKVTGSATYAYEYEHDDVAYGAIVQSTIAKGAITACDDAAAREVPGVLAVLWAGSAPRLYEAAGELALFQSRRVSYRGQIVAAVIAESAEIARHAAGLVRLEYAEEPSDVELRFDHPDLYKPDKVNPSFETDTESGDVESALAGAEVSVDVTYETPAFHNNPMEPHATTAVWHPDGGVTLYDSTQGASGVRDAVAKAFGLAPDRVRVVAPHVGGGFGSKGTARPHVILAAMAAVTVRGAVKVAVTRQEMFAFTGYRTPTIQRLQLGANGDGRLSAIAHDVVEQTSTVQEFAEQTAVVTRMLYAAPNRRTTHRLAALDVPTPSWLRAPGECPGMYALESAMDELATACGLDPIELRIRNEPDIDPETGHPFSSRNLVACLREGAERFGWGDRDAAPGTRRDGSWLIGTGVAASTYPARRRPSQALARRQSDGSYLVQVAAADIGTGARTVLTQIAADALSVSVDRVRVEIGDTEFPPAPVAGGSMGTASWGSAVFKACRRLVDAGGDGEARVDTTDDIEADEPLARHGFGAQFAEVRVNVHTGELRVPRMLGVFAVGAILNPKTARSQLIGGMTMGIGMALLEESILDPRFGDYVNHDLAGYHVPTYADVREIEAVWIDERDDHLNPMGSKGIGEIGIVGTAAAVGNAVHHATGHRFRRLPIKLDAMLGALA